MKTIMEWIKGLVRALILKSTKRLFNKLILLFTTLILLVVVSLTFISSKMLENESITNIITSNTSNLKLVNKNFSNYIADIELISFPYFKFEQVMNAVLTESDDYSAKSYLEDYLRGLFYSRKDIEGIYLYLIDSKKYYYISREDQNPTVRNNSNEDIINLEWFKKATQNNQSGTVQSLLLSNKEGYQINYDKTFMAYHRTLRNLIDRAPKAVISFYMNTSVRDEIVKDIPLNEGEHIIFSDSNNKPFYLDDADFYDDFQNSTTNSVLKAANQEGRFTWGKGNGKYMVIYNADVVGDWKLMKAIPNSAIYKVAQTNRNLSFLIGFLFIAVSILFIALISNAITKPLKKLSIKMGRFSEGYFEVETEIKGRDEIALFSRQFNTMVTRIDDLINEKYKMKLIEKSAILKALEAEINPHFLYNALQAISTKALKNGMQDITEMVDALALTLRYCINGKDIVKLRDEIKHIENYLIIQKARFGSRLEVIYELDVYALDLDIPKLSIQSLVENCIKHALEKISTTITILIQVHFAGSNAVITVKDNGPGIDPDKLTEINQSLQMEWEDWDDESIGLKNLNARLKLIFGDEAGVLIQSSAAGTEMSIIIPGGSRSQDV
ncbi:sensor histidine kinase [Paenibacillus psychroresistens]|uniref:Sensor histidine kinase n=1 Tax=Paenibacillus psychroresistens TaxID=1778678 RepID=A0A6B8RM83_9BACL|nr:sensor histidine kinase [Paenibacillus psychroresistens]QGQ96458.1 sensor histidine kinase [Paenibacillus psychroresistens]